MPPRAESKSTIDDPWYLKRKEAHKKRMNGRNALAESVDRSRQRRTKDYTYHEMDDAWTFTTHDREMVLPFFTCTSWEPIILARAAVERKSISDAVKLSWEKNGFVLLKVFLLHQRW